MDNKILDQIRKKTIGANKETTFDIRPIETKCKIPGVYFLRSAHMFHIDPVPFDNWIVDGEKIRPGREILDVLREKNYSPSSKEEAIEAAKLVFALEDHEVRVYPDFNAKGCKKPKAVEKDGVYEVTLFISYGFFFQPPRPVKVVMRIGKGIYEMDREQIKI